MSVTGRPRFHFFGNIIINVCTANNNDAVDENYIDDAVVSVDTAGRTDTEMRTWLKQLGTGGIRGGWNVYGDNGCSFDGVTITAVDLGAGGVLTTAAQDPLVGAAVHLGAAKANNGGVMCDAHPEGGLGTQILSDELRAQAGTTILWKGRPTRFYSRWIDGQRNLAFARSFTGASAVWQAGVPLDALTFGAAASPGLDALRASGAKGLLMRFCTYLVAPTVSSADLAAHFAQGGTDVNAARGVVLGTIGPWETDDPLATSPTGRRLDAASPFTFNHTQYVLGPAAARVDHATHTVALDLITTFPEVSRTREKLAPGPMSLAVHVPGETKPRRIGPVPTDKTTYESGGGVVDVPVPAELEAHLDTGMLLLQVDTTGVAALAETEQTVETDDRAVYLQVGEQTSITIQYRARGAAPGSAVVVPLEQYLALGGSVAPAETSERMVDIPDNVTTDADGTATISVVGLRPGGCVVRFLTSDSTPGRFGGPLDWFATLRVLPEDDFSTVPDARLTFDFVYENVLRYYWVIYPTMDRFVDLHDEQSVIDNAGTLRERIAKSAWSTWEYMPRTRELSDGKRALLDRYLALQGG